ncbi:MAG: ArsR family transcriptional regulator [Candidatus Thermoplasmatota archaeon]|jgi:predicted transcriptional regulator
MLQESDGKGTRERLLKLIQEHPGIHQSELAKRAEIPWGSVSHHLHQLKCAGRISTLRRGSRYLVYPASIETNPYLPLLREPAVARIISHLQGPNSKRIAELTQETGLSRKVVARGLRKLHGAGLAARSDDYHPRFWLQGRAAKTNGGGPFPQLAIMPN